MQRMNFNFDYKKATQALNVFASKEGGQINKMKALKLIHLADRYHIRKYGRLITNDIYFAMNYGPVASSVKDIAEESEFLGEMERGYAIHFLRTTTQHGLESVKSPDTNIFSDSDIEALDFVWGKFAHLDPFQLAELTHNYPEWAKHKQALKLDSRIQMDLNDFFDDPDVDIEKCFALTEEDKEIRRAQIEEMINLESLWS